MSTTLLAASDGNRATQGAFGPSTSPKAQRFPKWAFRRLNSQQREAFDRLRWGRPGPADRARLRAYPGWAAAASARRAFLKAIKPQASWRSARWFSSFLHQRMRRPRFRFSQEWVASTTQRRARQPGIRAFNLISSPRARMCGV